MLLPRCNPNNTDSFDVSYPSKQNVSEEIEGTLLRRAVSWIAPSRTHVSASKGRKSLFGYLIIDCFFLEAARPR
jgi:hypothetical protein